MAEAPFGHSIATPAEDFHFTRRVRSWRAILGLCLWLSLLSWLVLSLDAVWWLTTALALPCLPALYELWQNPQASLCLTQQHLTWASGSHRDTVALADIDHIRFDTRWDFSKRVSLILKNGKTRRLPPQVVPPHQHLETKLQARGLSVIRHHFSVF